MIELKLTPGEVRALFVMVNAAIGEFGEPIEDEEKSAVDKLSEAFSRLPPRASGLESEEA
jgi:hypothetical protein